jgi:Domain of unknown function (DUF4112)
MSALLGKAGKKLFEKHLQAYEPPDPVYETYTNDRGKVKQRRVSARYPPYCLRTISDPDLQRELPPGLSERDAKILLAVKRRARRLDKGFNLCGLRFGYTFFLSLIPIVGDVTCAVLNYSLVVRKARQADIPQWLVSKMMANNALSLGVSFIPLVGDVILAVYGANSRNAALLEAYLAARGAAFLEANPDGVIPSTKKKGWWRMGGKSKPTVAPNDYGAAQSAGGSSHLTTHDVQQLRPGAGLKTGELVDGGGQGEEVAARHPPGALNV